MLKPSPEAQETAYKISDFYLTKHRGNYTDAIDDIDKLRISNIEVIDGVVSIHTPRPGLLIGRKGENINALSAFLGVQIKICESYDWESILFPYDPADYFA
jgi:predicted RNA-binding protein Jag